MNFYRLYDFPLVIMSQNTKTIFLKGDTAVKCLNSILFA